jgi:hypothetical protein
MSKIVNCNVPGNCTLQGYAGPVGGGRGSKAVPGTFLKAVGLVRDKAGNIAENITENLPAVAKAVALSGLIKIGKPPALPGDSKSCQ